MPIDVEEVSVSRPTKVEVARVVTMPSGNTPAACQHREMGELLLLILPITQQDSSLRRDSECAECMLVLFPLMVFLVTMDYLLTFVIFVFILRL